MESTAKKFYDAAHAVSAVQVHCRRSGRKPIKNSLIKKEIRSRVQSTLPNRRLISKRLREEVRIAKMTEKLLHAEVRHLGGRRKKKKVEK